MCDPLQYDREKLHHMLKSTRPAPFLPEGDTGTCVMVQVAGRELYDDDDLEGPRVWTELVNNSVELATKSAGVGVSHLYYYNFDAGDDEDAETPAAAGISMADLESDTPRFWFGGGNLMHTPDPANAPSEMHVVKIIEGMPAPEGEGEGLFYRWMAEKERAYGKKHAQVGVVTEQRHDSSARVQLVADFERTELTAACKLAGLPCTYKYLPSWDFSMPSREQLKEYIDDVLAAPEGSLFVLHCGAGTGRTGYYVLATKLADIYRSNPAFFDSSDNTSARNLARIATRTYSDSMPELLGLGGIKMDHMAAMMRSIFGELAQQAGGFAAHAQ